MSVRSRKLIYGITSGFAARGVSMAAPLITTPMFLGYYGQVVFGLWATVQSILIIASFRDLGLGTGIQNKLTVAFANGDRTLERQTIINGTLLLSGVAAALLGILYLVAASVDLDQALNFQVEGHDGLATRMILTVFTITFLTLPLNVVTRVQYANNEVWLSNLWMVLGAAATVPAVYFATTRNLGLEATILAGTLPPGIAQILATIHYTLYKKQISLWPGLRYFNLDTCKSLLRSGFGFFFITMLITTAQNNDNIVISRVLAPEEVTPYSNIFRLFSFITVIVTLFGIPLWPAVGEAMVKKDFAWVRKTNRQITVYSLATVGVLGGLLVAFHQQVYRLWLNTEYTGPAMVPALFLLLAAMNAIAQPWFTVQNSVGKLTSQYLGWSIYFVVSIPLKIWLSSHWGVEGTAFANVFCYFAIVMPFAFFGYRSTMRKLGAAPGRRTPKRSAKTATPST